MSEQIKKEKNELYKKLFKNIMIAIVISIYFIFLNLGSVNIENDIFLTDIKVFSMIILGISIIIFEKAYRKDSGELTINAIETLVLASYTLSIIYVTNLFKFDFRYYVLTSSYIFSIYYVFKDIIIYTRENRKYLRELSDISDIVKKEEPSKKKATKKNVNMKDTTRIENENEANAIENIKIEDEKEDNNEKVVEEIKIPKAETKKTVSKKSTTRKTPAKKSTTKNSKSKTATKKVEKTENETATKTTTTKNRTTKKLTKSTTKTTVNAKKKTENKNDEKLEKSVEEENKPKRRGRPKKKVEE